MIGIDKADPTQYIGSAFYSTIAYGERNNELDNLGIKPGQLRQAQFWTHTRNEKTDKFYVERMTALMNGAKAKFEGYLRQFKNNTNIRIKENSFSQTRSASTMLQWRSSLYKT